MLPIEDLLKDHSLVDSIIHSCESRSEITETINKRVSDNDVKEFLLLARAEGIQTATTAFPMSIEIQSVIREIGRPAIFIQNNSFKKQRSEEWRDRLEAARTSLERIIPSVGRIDISNYDQPGYPGSGWLVAPNTIVTASHVAKKFSKISERSNKIIFKTNQTSFKKMGASIDFRKEHKVEKEEKVEVSEVIYFEETENPDVAFLKISPAASQKKVIEFDSAPIKRETRIAVIGYPDRDLFRSVVSAAEVNAIFKGVYKVKRLLPGKVISVQTNTFTHDCSALGGNSGSVVVNLDTGKAIGLHVQSSAQEEKANIAVSYRAVQQTLDLIGN